MFDASKALQDFYDTHVRLGKDRRNALAGYRDSNLTRLKDGLAALGVDRGTGQKPFRDWRNQGGYAMVTINQHPSNEYDIDVAVLFNADDLPDDAAAARKLVRDAFLKRPGNFKKPPAARSNAVTVWYQDGYHIDFAIYRIRTDFFGFETVEHAGADGWAEREPDEITDWFHGRVDDLSPAETIFGKPKVAPKQLRRIVRLLKFFTKSRSSWEMPGGLVVSALAAECYRADRDRDDRSLYATMVAIRDRIAVYGTAVANPAGGGRWLTTTDEHHGQVAELGLRLDWAIGKLAPLFDADCDGQKAQAAWKQVFNHDFWAAKSLLKAATAAGTFTFPNRPAGPVKPAGFA